MKNPTLILTMGLLSVLALSVLSVVEPTTNKAFADGKIIDTSDITINLNGYWPTYFGEFIDISSPSALASLAGFSSSLFGTYSFLGTSG